MSTKIGMSFQPANLTNYYASTFNNRLELRVQVPLDNPQVNLSLQCDDSNNYALLVFQTPAEWRNFVRAMVAFDYSLGDHLTEEAN